MKAAKLEPPATTLTVAAGAQREAAIETWLQTTAGAKSGRCLVIAEGLLHDRQGPREVPVLALAAGCPCCIGLVALRVLLARALRRYRPSALLLLLSSAQHLPRVRAMLASGELGVRLAVDQ